MSQELHVSVFSGGMTIWLDCASDTIIDARHVRRPSVRREIRLFIGYPIPTIIYGKCDVLYWGR